MNLAEACAVCSFVPELGPEAHELLLDVGEKVSASVLYPESVSDGEYFLVDDVLCSSKGRIRSWRLTHGLWACRLEGYGCSASSAETAAGDESLAAGGASRIGHQLRSRDVGCSGPKRELCPLKRTGGEALLQRESVDTYPPFSWKISCLALILGESWDSSPGLGFDRRGKIVVIFVNPERFSGPNFGVRQIRDQG